MALPFAKYQTVLSRQSGRRGTIIKIEFDEFFHCIMYCVRFDDGIVTNLDRGSADYWFKAADIKDPSDKSIEVPVAAV